MDIFTVGFLYFMAQYGLIQFGLVWFGLIGFGLVWFGMVWDGIVWYGLVWFYIKKNRETSCLNERFYALWIPRSGPKVCGGEMGEQQEQECQG